jgi:hypothetical protein
MSGDENLWYVKTPDGDVHRVTLDQLDDAFQAGRIDENVMVLAAGATKWAKLSELAGLDEPAAAPPSRMAPVPMAMPSSLRPVSMDLSADLDDENAFRKKSRKGLVVAVMLGVVGVFGGVLFLNRSHLVADSSTAAAAAIPPAAQAAAAPPATTTDGPAAPLPTTTAVPSPPDTPASKLTEDQKAKLAAADKALDQKSKALKKTRAVATGSAPHHGAKYKSQGFTTGGNKYDPMNASF